MLEEERRTITMRGISELAKVSRNTVTMWQKRYDGTSLTPFPSPISVMGKQKLFDYEEIGNWLKKTGKGNTSQPLEDAPFYSTIFDRVLNNAVLAAVALKAMHQEQDAQLTVSSSFRKDLIILSEAAFGPLPVLRKLNNAFYALSVDALNSNGVRLVVDSLKEIACSYEADGRLLPFCPLSSGALPIALFLQRELGEKNNLSILLSPNRVLSDLDHTVLNELECYGTNIQVIRSFDELPSDAVVLGLSLDEQSFSSSLFFDQLDNAVLSLNSEGTALVIAPTALLLENVDAVTTINRKKLLSNTETGGFFPLRYAARLPRGWARNLGQRQLGLWLIKPTGETRLDAVRLAELSGMDEQDIPNAVSDIVTVAMYPDATGKHSFIRSKLGAPGIILRSDSLIVENESSSSICELKSLNSALGDLWDLEAQSGVSITEAIPLEENQGRSDKTRSRYVSWDVATKGRNKLIRVIGGSKIPVEELVSERPGTVEIIGIEEIRDPETFSSTKYIDRLRLENLVGEATITEPFDVVFTKKGSPEAVIDFEGGKLVQAPAQIARCLTLRGRSNTPQNVVTTPFFVLKAIKGTDTSDTHSWRVQTVEAKLLPHMLEAHSCLEKHRKELKAKLTALNRLEDSFASALASHALIISNPTNNEL